MRERRAPRKGRETTVRSPAAAGSRPRNALLRHAHTMDWRRTRACRWPLSDQLNYLSLDCGREAQGESRVTRPEERRATMSGAC